MENNMSRRKFVGALGATSAVLAAGALAGCSSGSGSAASASASAAASDASASASAAAGSASATASGGGKKCVLGYYGGTCEAPMFVGFENGYFAEEGLEPELLNITSELATLFANGELDVVEATPDFFKMMENGLALTLTDSLHKGCIQGAASKESGIKSVEDLEGKRVGTNAGVGGIPQIQIASQMVKAGKDPNKVEWLVYENPVLEKAMNDGEIDAMASFDPFCDIAVANGATKFFSDTFDEGLKDYLCCFVGIYTDRLDSDPDFGKAVSRAFKKSCEFLEANPEEAAQIIIDGGYVAVNGDNGFTKDIMVQEIKDYTWIAGDQKLFDDSFHEIWMQVYRAGAMPDAPKDEKELNDYIDVTLYNMMTRSCIS